MIFFLDLHPEKKLGLYYKPEKNPGAKPEKISRFAEPEIFLGFEIYFDFSRLYKSGCRLKDRLCRFEGRSCNNSTMGPNQQKKVAERTQ